MKNRYKILIVAYLLSFLVFGVGITYSIFHSKTSLEGEAKNVAKFIFDQDEPSWETISFNQLERESSDGSYKKIVNLMTKVSK